MLRKEIKAKSLVKKRTKYFISLPRKGAHSGHPTGLQPAISRKIVDMVEAGIIY